MCFTAELLLGVCTWVDLGGLPMNTEFGVFLGPVFVGILQNHKSVREGGREPQN
jgi:hypothetical protein